MDSVKDWKKAVLAHTEGPDHVQAADVLAIMLNGEASPGDTAKCITKIYETELKSKNESTYMHDEQQVTYFWTYHMCMAICTFGSVDVQERLFDLLVAISKQPDVKTPDGSVKKYHDCDVCWRDVPGWSYNFAVQALCKSIRCSSSGVFANMYTQDYNGPQMWRHRWKEEFLDQASHYLNGTKFAAMLLEKGAFSIGLPGKASDALSLGLERLYTKESDQSMDSVEAQVLLPAATTWLLVAGKAIYSHCLNNETETYGADVKTREGWGGGTWTLQRWETWQRRLQEFLERDDIDGECREIVTKTLRKMAEIETEREGQ
jgi:hypothetical protein